jgi:hypothetical protein
MEKELIEKIIIKAEEITTEYGHILVMFNQYKKVMGEEEMDWQTISEMCELIKQYKESINHKCTCGYQTEVGRIWCRCKNYTNGY